ncbi:CDP-glycerol glycerophosphotransferase family protein [Methanobrevibacter sp.]
MGIKSKLRNLKECAANSMIYNVYYNEGIDDKLVYLESRDGLDFTGNVFRIVEELSTGKYGDLKIFVHAKPNAQSKIESLKKNYDLRIDKVITKEANATKVLEKAKYIITDSGIRPKYVKRPGQIVINTWHGTPLKVMGFDNTPEEHRLGNVQHPYLSSDYLLYPNEYMREKMLHAYMIEDIYPGKLLLEGYPRNSVFFDEDKREALKSKLNLSDNEVFVYMPTFRGILMERNEEGQKEDVEHYLRELDAGLTDSQVLFAKLHVLNASKIDFTDFDHVKPFPEDYEIYDILNVSDVLITDYSSVFFDYANSRRKIVLFNYDEDDYCSYRGFYMPLSDLPFPKVQSVDELLHELNSPIDYDDGEFLTRFCTYDNVNAVENICRCIFKGEDTCNCEVIKNDKPTVLLFAGDLSDNDYTQKLFGFLENVDRNEYNFFITYKQWEENILENHPEIFEALPSNVGILPFRINFLPTVKEKLEYDKFVKNNEINELSEKLFKRSFIRQFGDLEFDGLIDFYKNDDYISVMFSQMIKENSSLEDFVKSNFKNLT